MKVVLDGEPGILAHDWIQHITSRPGGGYDIEVERRVLGRGQRLSLENAVLTAELLTTSSFASNKISIFPGPKKP